MFEHPGEARSQSNPNRAELCWTPQGLRKGGQFYVFEPPSGEARSQSNPNRAEISAGLPRGSESDDSSTCSRPPGESRSQSNPNQVELSAGLPRASESEGSYTCSSPGEASSKSNPNRGRRGLKAIRTRRSSLLDFPGALGASGPLFGASWGRLEASWSRLGAISGPSWGPLGRLGRLLGWPDKCTGSVHLFLGRLRSSWGPSGPRWGAS